MLRRRSWRRQPPRETHLVEVVAPRSSTAGILPAENLVSSLGSGEPFALEIAGNQAERRFLLRADCLAMRQSLESQFAVIYPQAQLRAIDPSRDPARQNRDELVAAYTLVLRKPAYLPLRTFRDADLRDAQADPVLGILGALSTLPHDWHGLAQLVLRPAPADWCAPYLRLAVEDPLTLDRVRRRETVQNGSLAPLIVMLAATTLGLQGAHWYAADAWGHLAMLIGSIAGGILLLGWTWRHLGRQPIYDRQLVQEKIRHPAYFCQIRLAVFGPTGSSVVELQERLSRLAAAYRPFGMSAGNTLEPRRLDLRGRELTQLTRFRSARQTPVLTTHELAGLWHLPHGDTDVPLLERTGARQRPPRPETVAHGARIGVAQHRGQPFPVALPESVLERHLLLVAKTRRGKSSLLLRLAYFLMETQPNRTLVVIDPHQDLAHSALGLVPTRWQDRVVSLDVSHRTRPFGLNLLDVRLFGDRDKAVANTLTIFRREFDRFWGPRMEDAFRFALLTLYEANRVICAADPRGRARQHTVLDVPALLVDPAFRRRVLELVTDLAITTWWTSYFERLDRRFQLEIANPVQTKVQRFVGSRVARDIIGQPQSTINPAEWLAASNIVLVNTAKGVVGEDTSALIGATLLNLVSLLVAEQAALEPMSRHAVTFIVDEFHTMPGADYEAILAELAKYGANLILATQSLARLDLVDRDNARALRSTLFANLDGLVAFQTSAEDARYLVRELGSEIDEQDLVSLPHHQCYVKIFAGDDPPPTFSVQLDAPPQSDPALAAQLASDSVARFGRDRAAVERDLQAALERIQDSHQSAATTGTGVARDLAATTERSQKSRRQRNDHRPPKRQGAGVEQTPLFDSPVNTMNPTSLRRQGNEQSTAMERRDPVSRVDP